MNMDLQTIAVIATYPARLTHLKKAVESLAGQVGQIVIVANQYSQGSLEALLPRKTEIIYPSSDLKDTGKFLKCFGEDRFHFLCDDDIIYPQDYCASMVAAYQRYAEQQAIVGLHGVTYSDFFEGRAGSRTVMVFSNALEEDIYVNQLGSGTILCKGYQLPPFSYMESSARYVDLRYAVYCQEKGISRICLKRERNWLRDQEPEETLFTSFTSIWPSAVTREAQKVAGLRFLPSLSSVVGK